jgi:hypothetical protein
LLPWGIASPGCSAGEKSERYEKKWDGTEAVPSHELQWVFSWKKGHVVNSVLEAGVVGGDSPFVFTW